MGSVLVVFACSDPPRGAGAGGAGGVGGLPVGGAVRGDVPGGAVRPRGRGGQQRVHGHVPLRRVPARRPVRVPRLRPGPGLPLQVLAGLLLPLAAGLLPKEQRQESFRSTLTLAYGRRRE